MNWNVRAVKDREGNHDARLFLRGPLPGKRISRQSLLRTGVVRLLVSQTIQSREAATFTLKPCDSAGAQI
jgi:hypothetical protein